MSGSRSSHTDAAPMTWGLFQELGYVVVWVRRDGSIETYADCGARIMNHREARRVQKAEREKYAATDPKRCRIAIVKGFVR